MQSKRPLILAHRGAKEVAPENTMPAFEKAIELGADGIELDVQYSSDGALMVIHNTTLEKTTDGTGKVISHTQEELRRLDAGSWFGPHFKGECIPYLHEVFERFGRRTFLNVELKSLTLQPDGMDKDVAELIQRYDLYDYVLVSSFNPFVLRRLKQRDPRIRTGLLYAPAQPLLFRRAFFRHWVKPNALHPFHQMVNAAYVAWIRRKGYALNVWTVNEEAEMRRLIGLGVDAIITDHPNRLRALLDKG